MGYHSQSAWSELGYMQAVKRIASNAIAEYPDGISNNVDDVDQFVFESVDSNEYVIYYGANEIALRATNNEPYSEDLTATSTDWRVMRQLAVIQAMEADVWVELDRLAKTN